MPPNKRRIKKRSKNRHLLLVFFLIVLAVFFYFEESGKDTIKRAPVISGAPERTAPPVPEKDAPSDLPRVSIVMDDLGPNKKQAETVFELNAPITLSILPHETYTKWIAEEGNRRGYRMIAHIPMEAISPHKLGKGGLTTWMTDNEIQQTLAGDIRSIPYISGVSNHMGSAFTKDKRAMRIVLTELHGTDLFFLDSLTTSGSVAYETAKEMGIPALQRDVFLDNTDDLSEINTQWKRLLTIAQNNGQAIALAHPRENTLKFLRKALEENDSIEIVPLTELLSN